MSPESPAYATDAVRPGAVVTHINDAPVASNWKDFVQQLSAPHPKTGCWVLNTNHNGTKNKFAMVARKVQIKYFFKLCIRMRIEGGSEMRGTPR